MSFTNITFSPAETQSTDSVNVVDVSEFSVCKSRLDLSFGLLSLRWLFG